jgi:hypothetical protein
MNMKKLFTLMLISVATLSLSCKKEKETTITPKDLLGSWEMRSFVGGYQDVSVPPMTYPPGNGNILRFTETNYEKLSKGRPSVTGTYELKLEKFQAGKLMSRIIYDGKTDDTEQFVEIVDGKLKVYFGIIAADGTESLYQKIQVAN